MSVVWWGGGDVVGKGFRCNFSDGVVCPHKKSEKSFVWSKCEKCVHYLRFVREIEEEEEFFEEIDRIGREEI
jgi:hypothetical protein